MSRSSSSGFAALLVVALCGCDNNDKPNTSGLIIVPYASTAPTHTAEGPAPTSTVKPTHPKPPKPAGADGGAVDSDAAVTDPHTDAAAETHDADVSERDAAGPVPHRDAGEPGADDDEARDSGKDAPEETTEPDPDETEPQDEATESEPETLDAATGTEANDAPDEDTPRDAGTGPEPSDAAGIGQTVTDGAVTPTPDAAAADASLDAAR